MRSLYWQGIFGKRWPYSKSTPLSIDGIFSTEVTNIFMVDLEENVWKSRDGNSNFNECMDDRYMKDCKSIFDPRIYTNQ